MVTLHPADRLAYDKALVAQPVWNRFETAGAAVRLAENFLLHAGPPFRSIDEICQPIMNSACVAAVYEGLAKDFDTAEAMIRAEEIVLRPAQDYSVVVPLASVVSASMPLHGVYDAHGGQVRVYTPINGGSRPSLRFGTRSEAVLRHIRWLNESFRDVLQEGMAEGIALLPLAVAGLANGDDCHGRTTFATKALMAELEDRTPGGIKDAAVRDFMASSPTLFLNLWMAATKCLLTAAVGVVGGSFVTAAGGNGIEAGIQISGLPGQWFTTKAAAPEGKLDQDNYRNRTLGAIGDSAVIEAFGLGAMAIDLSPEQRRVLGDYLPQDSGERIATLLIDSHPYFRSLNIKLGVAARSVVGLNRGPIIALGILDREGCVGRLGAGIYDMPAGPFAAALAALDPGASG